jgi:CDP-diacylglycerol--glycerol-3-phosphate 3-phosphatidyltransferase
MQPTVPNLLCALRVVLAPVLVLLARAGLPRAFLALLGVSMLSDLVDGALARRLNQQSEYGAQLDSWADLATYISLPLCGLWLWPERLRAVAPEASLIVGLYLVPVLAGILKFGRLPSLHTWLAKTSAVCVGLAAVLLFALDLHQPLRWCVPLAALTALDELAAIVLLPTWTVNVRSAWQARQIGRAARRP